MIDRYRIEQLYQKLPKAHRETLDPVLRGVRDFDDAAEEIIVDLLDLIRQQRELLRSVGSVGL